MVDRQMNGDKIAERGEALYQDMIRSQVETPENIGKMVIIDVETGDYEVDATGLKSAQRLQDKHPNTELCGIPIGYKVAEALGGVLERSDA